MLPLDSARLCIRPFRQADADAFAQAVFESVSSLMAWMPWCHADYSTDEALEWFTLCADNLQSETSYEFGIFTSDGKTLLGGISINQINREHNFGNIGYWIRASRQRQGLASEAVRVITAYGFKELGLTRLEILAQVDNVASRRVAEKSGASFECVARNRLWFNGRPCDGAMYALIPPPEEI
jgi:RimJ/RimL family protein N-acetyltransferase